VGRDRAGFENGPAGRAMIAHSATSEIRCLALQLGKLIGGIGFGLGALGRLNHRLLERFRAKADQVGQVGMADDPASFLNMAIAKMRGARIFSGRVNFTSTSLALRVDQRQGADP